MPNITIIYVITISGMTEDLLPDFIDSELEMWLKTKVPPIRLYYFHLIHEQIETLLLYMIY